MYKGWVKCSPNFQKMVGFNYKSKQKRHNGKYKYFDCEINDQQLAGMRSNWRRFKSVDIEWNLEKSASDLAWVKEGMVVAALLHHDNYFFWRYNNIRHKSVLKEWTDYNGLYSTSLGKEVKEYYIADTTHITDKCLDYDTHTKAISKEDLEHNYSVDKLNDYIKVLDDIKNKIIKLQVK